jgi:hypothetical protein
VYLLEHLYLPLQGGGRWFKSSIAHLEKVVVCRQNLECIAKPHDR